MPPCGPPDGGAWESPCPGVVNRAPRVFRNTLNGVTGAVVVSLFPPPSQLISRRPVANDVATLPLSVPQSCAERIDRPLNRVGFRSGCLEDRRRFKVLCVRGRPNEDRHNHRICTPSPCRALCLALRTTATRLRMPHW